MDRFVKHVPCVDVVMPVFNGRDTIRSALQSVLVQEGELVNKIIVVDDGSSDGTAEVVESLGCARIQVVRTPNRGVAAARNLGIELAGAEWIAFLDADDQWAAGKLLAQLSAAHQHGAGFVCGAVNAQSVMASSMISVGTLARGNFVATSSVLVKREILQGVQPVFVLGMSFAEDYLAWLKCLTVSRGYYLSATLATYILSERPRYRWGQILRNILKVNLLYAAFLRSHVGSPIERLRLQTAVFLGSMRSIISIVRRFLNAPRARDQAT